MALNLDYDHEWKPDAPKSAGPNLDFDPDWKPAPAPKGGLVASAKQAIGSTIKGAGQAAADFLPGVGQDNALKTYGQSVVDANPTAVHSLADLKANPLTGVAEATGNAGGSMGAMLGARALGTGITAAAPFTGPAAPLVAGIGQVVSWAGPAAAAALPSFGGIREKQIQDDPTRQDSVGSKLLAAAGAGTVGLIESKLGPNKWAEMAMSKQGRDALAEKFVAKSLTGSIAKGAAKGAAIEGAEEIAQNPIEQIASYQNPLTADNLKDTAFSGVMGALGGGVLGGASGAAFRKGAEPKPAATPEVAPAAPVANPADSALMQQQLLAEQEAAAMGIDAANGPISAAASLALKTGAAQTPAQLAVQAERQRLAEAALQQDAADTEVADATGIDAQQQNTDWNRFRAQEEQALKDERDKARFETERKRAETRGEMRDAAQQMIAEGSYEADQRKAAQEARQAEDPGLPFERIAPEDFDTLNPIKAGQGELVDPVEPERKGLSAPKQQRALPNQGGNPALGFTPKSADPMRATADGQVGTAQQFDELAKTKQTRKEQMRSAVERARDLISQGATLKGRNLVDASNNVVLPNLNIQQYREANTLLKSKPNAQAAETPASAIPVQAAPQGQKQQSAGVTPAQDISGDKINREWTSFAPETGTLAVPRAEMPQIKAEHRGAMANFMNARGVSHAAEEVRADSLRPTQAEFSPSKVKRAMKFQGGDRSILVSADNYVLDGHHQWLAKREAGEPIKVIRLNAPISDLISLAHDFPSSTMAGGATGKQSLQVQAPAATEESSVVQPENSNGNARPASETVPPVSPAQRGVNAGGVGNLRADRGSGTGGQAVRNDAAEPAASVPDSRAGGSGERVAKKPKPAKQEGSGLDRAVRVLMDRTDGNGSPDGLIGPENQDARAEIISALTGKPAESLSLLEKSVGAMEYHLHRAAGITEGSIKDKRSQFIDWIDKQDSANPAVEKAAPKQEQPAQKESPASVSTESNPAPAKSPANQNPIKTETRASAGLETESASANQENVKPSPALESTTAIANIKSAKEFDAWLADNASDKFQLSDSSLSGSEGKDQGVGRLRLEEKSRIAQGVTRGRTVDDSDDRLVFKLKDGRLAWWDYQSGSVTEVDPKDPRYSENAKYKAEISQYRIDSADKPKLPLEMTPKQYHAAKLKAIADEYGIAMSEVRENYDTPEQIAIHNQEWIDEVRDAFRDGSDIDAKVLDRLYELRPGALVSFMHDNPDAQIPNGYQTPSARKTESEYQDQLRSDRKAVAADFAGKVPLESLFADLDSSAVRKANKAKKAAKLHPQAAEIDYVQNNYHDILIQLMDAGKLEVNGSKSVTEENKSCL